MSDHEDDYDIAGALTLDGDQSDSDIGSDSESYSQDEEIQDIIESDHEEEQAQPKQKKQKTAAFPSLELSDNEDDDSKQDNDVDDLKDISSYFANNNPDVKKAKAGSFQSFGFSKFLMSNIIKKGYRQPTPIQRKTIPLIMDGRDVVGMARTGSGKTAAFTLPIIERLKTHSARVGARAVILSPSRELALQTYKQVKEFTKNTDLKSIVLIGGDSLEEQFSSVLSNPDIIVATPGRFLHLKVEMDLDLKSIEYIIFDEADRLFEMGFAEQLNELLASLPSSRQSLLFSATLPRSLVDFAKAGLTSPVLVRLDADSKISDNLQMAFFTTKRSEREANLLYVLQEVIKIPLGTPEQLKKLSDLNKRSNEEDEEEEENRDKSKKRKFKKERLPPANQLPSEHSTIVFVPTKHHVEYIYQLLRDAGYLVSYIYGTLDQHARKNQLYQFRIGVTNILVVTDVAARGIDIPVLANVINFTFPASSKIFIHRVGRTARAGNKGWAYSIINEKELPYLLDLELFLGKKILLTSMYEEKAKITGISQPISYTDRLVLGSMPRLALETFQELYENLLNHNYDLKLIKDVTFKAEKLYYRTRQAASAESLKRSKEIFETDSWDNQHLLFGPDLEKEKQEFLNKLLNRNVKETVFEFSKRNNAKSTKGEDEDNNLVDFMNKRRKQIAPIQRKAKERKELLQKERIAGLTHGLEDEVLQTEGESGYNVNEDEIKSTFEDADDIIESKKQERKKSYRDPNFFISHYAPASLIQDQQLQLSNSFANDAAKATFDLNNDDTDNNKKNQQVMQWDRKKGKYINSMSDSKKYIIGESGQKIPATYRSGRFDDWKKQRNLQPAKVGSLESSNGNGNSNKRFQHKKVAAPKLPDKFRDDYHKQKKKVDKAVESGVSVKGYNRPGHQQEIKTTEQIRKARQLKENRRAKNARPSRKRK